MELPTNDNAAPVQSIVSASVLARGLPTPYYEKDGITIYHGDSLALLPLIECSVVISDPPYCSGGFQESAKTTGSIGTRQDATIQLDNLSTRGPRGKTMSKKKDATEDFGSSDCSSALIQCPDCEGGKIVCMCPKYVEGVTGPPVIVLDCDRCNGTGQIPAAMMEWIEIGNQCRSLREIEDLGLRSGAVEYGMLPSELSRIECGKVDPTEHAQRLGVL